MTAYAVSSRMLKDAPVNVIKALGSANVTMNNHVSGVQPDVFAKNAKLSGFYNIISTNVDRKGRAFVSSIEGKTAPVYATQWHPEKNIYEWTPKEDIPHSADAVDVAHHVARFLVNEARKSNHVMTEEELEASVIWNYAPVFTGKDAKSGFDQCYFFNADP
eukprot:UC1_evm1s991